MHRNKTGWKHSPGVSAKSFKVQSGAILLSLSRGCLERLRDWLSPVSLLNKCWGLSKSRSKDSSWLFACEAPLQCFTGLPVYIETVSVDIFKCHLLPGGTNWKPPREHRQLCRWGDKTLRNNWQNPVQKSMNAKMEATTSENTFPSGQAMCTQMWRLRNGKEQAVSFLSLKIMLLLVFLNPSPFTQKCAFYLRNTFLPHESQNVVGSLWGYRELNWFGEGICSFC